MDWGFLPVLSTPNGMTTPRWKIVNDEVEEWSLLFSFGANLDDLFWGEPKNRPFKRVPRHFMLLDQRMSSHRHELWDLCPLRHRPEMCLIFIHRMKKSQIQCLFSVLIQIAREKMPDVAWESGLHISAWLSVHRRDIVFVASCRILLHSVASFCIPFHCDWGIFVGCKTVKPIFRNHWSTVASYSRLTDVPEALLSNKSDLCQDLLYVNQSGRDFFTFRLFCRDFPNRRARSYTLYRIDHSNSPAVTKYSYFCNGSWHFAW
jgi:hypothetical protein